MHNKKAIASIIAVVLIVGLTLAAFGVVYTVIIPLIKESVETSTKCGDINLFLNAGWSYFNENPNLAKVSVNRGPSHLETKENIELSAIQIKFTTSGGSSETRFITKDLPKENEGKTYDITKLPHDSKSIALAAKIKIGNKEQLCSMGDSKELEIIDEPCIPKCEGKSCGDDGCGGSCGNSPEGEFCTVEGKNVASVDEIVGPCITCCSGKADGEPDCCGNSCESGKSTEITSTPPAEETPSSCGDGTCNAGIGENCDSCSTDCGVCPSWNDNFDDETKIFFKENTTIDEGNIELSTKWKTEIVDNFSKNVGAFNSIDVDSNNNPCIGYKSYSTGELKYAKSTGSSWNIQTIDTGAPYQEMSLALDSNDNPHISYYWSTGYLKYATWSGSKWNIEIVDDTGQIGSRNSIAVDSLDRPHISYRAVAFPGQPGSGLKYAKKIGSTWSKEVVDICNPDSFHSTSITVDSNNNPHIVYSGSRYEACDDNSERYAKWNGNSWSKEKIGSDSDTRANSIAIDFKGHPHVIYCDQTSGKAKYAHWDGANWIVEPFADSSNCLSPSIALDSNSYPHIVYNNGPELKYIEWNGTEWKEQHVIDINPVSYLFSNGDIALDLNSKPYISYKYSTAGDSGYLKYARLSLNPTATITSEIITPTNLIKWNKFFATSVKPSNTNIKYEILNAADNSVLCSDLDGNENDISSCVGSTASIKLQAILTTTKPDNYLTPILKDWGVSWIE